MQVLYAGYYLPDSKPMPGVENLLLLTGQSRDSLENRCNLFACSASDQTGK